jgi:hypothetical protein
MSHVHAEVAKNINIVAEDNRRIAEIAQQGNGSCIRGGQGKNTL